MRKIKFRAWDIKLGEMISGENLIKMCIMISPANGSLITYNEPWNYLKDRMVLMQFTGLKDKNGKEIYEGDIVKHIYQTRTSQGVTIDEWNTQIGEIVYPKKYMAFMIRGFSSHDVYWAEKFGELEVIGNKFENQELLDVKK